MNFKYEKVEVVFISHSTTAERVNEKNFFKVGTYGGTIVSSALVKEIEIIEKEFHPNSWNIYSFYCGDGENWSTDNDKCLNFFKKIKEISQLTAYCEINELYEGLIDEEAENSPTAPWADFAVWKEEDQDNLWSTVTPICDKSFKRIMIGQSEHIWIAFKELFGGN